MEMDIGANNYPFQCFLCFLTLKLHPSFPLTTISHKSCNWATNFHKTEKYILQGNFWQNFVSCLVIFIWLGPYAYIYNFFIFVWCEEQKFGNIFFLRFKMVGFMLYGVLKRWFLSTAKKSNVRVSVLYILSLNRSPIWDSRYPQNYVGTCVHLIN